MYVLLLTTNLSPRYVTSNRHTIQVDYIPYMDELADQVGVQPRFLSVLLRDPGLWLRIVFGPCTPYQYRLCGPGHWEGARQAIYTQLERVVAPLKTRPIPAKETRRTFSAHLLSLSTVAALVVAVIYKKDNFQEYLQYPMMLLDRLKTHLPA